MRWVSWQLSFVLRVTLGLVALFVAVARSHAQISVHGTVNGVDTQIGLLEPTISDGDAGKFEQAIFELLPSFRFLMNDAMGCQFRFFQVAISDNDPQRPPLTNGSVPAVPYVDPPNGGYLGQASPMGVGADHAPFYENDDGAGPYAFQRYSDLFHSADSAFPDNTPVHDPALGRVNTDDFPDVSDGFRVDFETFIVFVDEQYRAEKKFDVLAGFGWGVYRMNNVLHLDGMGPNFSAIDAAHLMTLNNALADSLFADWTAETGLEVNTCVPEPSAVVLFAVGGLTLLVVARRKLTG